MIVCQHNYPVGFGGACQTCTPEEWKECLDVLQECLDDTPTEESVPSRSLV